MWDETGATCGIAISKVTIEFAHFEFWVISPVRLRQNAHLVVAKGNRCKSPHSGESCKQFVTSNLRRLCKVSTGQVNPATSVHYRH